MGLFKKKSKPLIDEENLKTADSIFEDEQLIKEEADEFFEEEAKQVDLDEFEQETKDEIDDNLEQIDENETIDEENIPEQAVEAAHEISKDFTPDINNYNTNANMPIDIVNTEIYNAAIDESIDGFSYSTNHYYRVGYDDSATSNMFTITPKKYRKEYNVDIKSSASDINWYNDLAMLGYSYAAVCGSKVIGIIICEPQYWNNTLYIRNLQVAKEYRRQNIGTRLVERCVQHAGSTNFRAICVETRSTNGAAIDFYKSNYFHMVGLNIEMYSNTDLYKGEVGLFMNRTIR